jgi:hypothetical protein
MAGSWALGRIWLKFPPGHPQHGLEVLMRRRLMREAEPDEEFDWLTDEQFEALTQKDRRAYLAAQVEHRCREFARLLIKWNFDEPVYDDEGDETGERIKVPPTAEGVGRLDPETFAALWTAYNEATTVVPPPLSQPSDAGEPSAEELTLPQEPL